MAKPVLFLIHGMGKHDDGWSQEVSDELDEIGGRYPTVDGALTDQLDLVEVTYDQLFEGQLERLQAEMSALQASKLYPEVEDALGWLEGAGDDEFEWTHAADVVLYLTRHVRNGVVSRVAARMAEVIAEKNDGTTEFHILAHSLGCSVATEATAALAEPIDSVGWPGLPPGFRFGEVLMVANVSRLLQRPEAKAYESRLLPKPAPGPRLADNYRSFAHKLDPIPRVRRFDFVTTAQTGYQSVTGLEHFYGTNVHSLLHYLEHPGVHGHLVRLPRTANLHHATWRAAAEEYLDGRPKQFGGEFAGVADVQALRAEIESRQPSQADDAGRLVSNLKTVLETLKEVLL